MAAASLATRNVRPKRVDYYEEEDSVEDGSEQGSEGEDEDEVGSDDMESAGEASEHSAMREEEDVEEYISSISFGALKEAQDQLRKKRKHGSEMDADEAENVLEVKKRKRGSETAAEQEKKLDALRARLRQTKTSKHGANTSSKPPKATHIAIQPAPPSDDEDDSDSAPSEVGGPKSRTSKHAPMSQSTKYQVTRKRTVVDVPKRITRDPRFDAFQQHPMPPGYAAKAYSFLRDYEKSEIGELKAAIKQAKSEEDRETLMRKMVSMENRVKTDVAKEREQEVLRQHRKEEKQRVEQGKKPFFLKQKDVKARAMVKKFESMKGKEREKLLERRRRKEDQQEKKRMPDARRVA